MRMSLIEMHTIEKDLEILKSFCASRAHDVIEED